MTDTIIPEMTGNNDPEPTEVTTLRLYQRGILDAAAQAGWKPYKLGEQLGWRYPIYRLDGSPFTDPETGQPVYRWKNANRDAKPKYRWVSRQNGCPSLYFLPEIQESIQDAGGIAYLVNGEPAVLAMKSAGQDNALCYLNGEGNPPSDLATQLKELGVTQLVHIPDKDNTGSNSVRKVSQLLASTGIKYVAIRLPDHLPAKADVNDLWIACGFDRDLFTDTLTTLTQNSEHWLPVEPAHPELTLPDQLGFSLDDIPDQDTDDAPDRLKSDSSNHKLPQAFLDAIVNALKAERKRDGWSQNIPCIFHHHEHDASNPAASWNHDKHIFHCLKCGETWIAIETGKQLGLDWNDYREQSSPHRNPTSTNGATPNMNTHKYDLRLASPPIPLPPPRPDSTIQENREAARNKLSERIPLTDVGNGRRLAERYGHKMRYLSHRKGWLIYDGTRWANDTTEGITRLAKETTEAILEETKLVEDGDYRAKLGKFYATSQNVNRLRAMIELAKSEPDIAIGIGRLNTNPFLLNCANGTIDLHTGELLPHNPTDLLTQITPIEFRPEDLKLLQEQGIEGMAMICPRWYAFLKNSQQGDMDVVRYIIKLLGYTATADNRHKCIILIQGPKNTGKTLFIEMVARVLGKSSGQDTEGYAKNTPFETFAYRSDTHQNPNAANDFLAELAGARMVYADESREQQRLDSALIKRLSGRSTINTRASYGTPFAFDVTFKLWLATNHLPDIPADDDAVWERIKLIPFENEIKPEDIVEGLDQIIWDTEMSGILASIVYGCLLWQEEKLTVPEVIQKATHDYQEDLDVFAMWQEERLVFVSNPAPVESSFFFKDFNTYCQSNHLRPLSRRIFYNRLHNLAGVTQTTVQGKQAGVLGVIVHPQANASDPTPP